MICHPIQTTKALAVASDKLANFLCKTCLLTPDNLRSFEAQSEADKAWRSAVDDLTELHKEFRQLPLHEKGRLCGRIGSIFLGPGLWAKGVECAGAIPKVQAGMAAIGRIANAEQAALRSFMLKTTAGTMLAANVETAELVNLGGKVMSAELAETIMQTYNKVGSNMPIADFVEVFENSVTPASSFLGKTLESVGEALHGEQTIEIDAILAEVAQDLKCDKSSALSMLKNYIKDGVVRDNRIEAMVDSDTKILFRKDFGEKAHALTPKRGYPKGIKIDHYNIEIQTREHAGTTIDRWNDPIANYHIVVDNTGKVTDMYKTP
jgi:hypothetical protein